MSRSSSLGQFTLLPVLADGADITSLGTTLADQVEKKVIMRFASTAARDALITSPEDGMECRITGTERKYRYTSGGAWELVSDRGSFTPTLGAIVIGTGGNARNLGSYRYAEGLLHVWGQITFGTAGATLPTSATTVSLPTGYTMTAPAVEVAQPMCNVTLIDTGTGFTTGMLRYSSASVLGVLVNTASGTYVGQAALSAVIPHAWAVGDGIEYSYVVQTATTP